MPTTTNYGWTTPADTDLVKDGASAIRTLGTAIDTTVFNNASAGIAKTIVDAKGDIIAATAADTVSRLAVGANDTVLTADSSTATGLKWAAPGAGANWSLLNSGGTSLSGSTTTISGISAKDKIMILIRNLETSSFPNANIAFRFNADSGANYYSYGMLGGPTYTSKFENHATTSLQFAKGSNNEYVREAVHCGLIMTGANSSGVKSLSFTAGASIDAPRDAWGATNIGYYNSSDTISSISVRTDIGTFNAGTVFVYTSA